jgi:hypothetical protein
MSWSSTWAIVALLITSSIAFFTLYREKPEEKPAQSRLKRNAKMVLCMLTGLVLIAGVFQILWADREGQKNEKKHAEEHDADKKQIAGLGRSVQTLNDANQTQYDRNQAELHKLQDQLNEIKIGKASEELRKKIGLLEAQLDKSLAPKPKAKLDFGFYDADLKKDEIRSNMYIPADGTLYISVLWLRTTRK